MKTLPETQVEGKNVLFRIDADVLNNDGVIKHDSRIQASLPTLKYLLENGAKVTIIGHVGRPEGREVPELKIRPVEDKLIELLGTHNNWQILENLRFNKGEEENDPEFAKQLAIGQDIFVQDAFATCHRAHASTVGAAKLLPSFAGMSVQRELEGLQKILASPAEGFTIIIGGKKAEDKLPVIKNLFDKAENFLVGGVVADTFLACQNYDLGKSLIEKEAFEQAREIFEMFSKDSKKKLVLPTDLIFSKSSEAPVEPIQLSVLNLKSSEHHEWMVVDIGEETVNNFRKIIYNSKNIFWNGNLGVTEVPDFAHATKAIAETVVDSNTQKYAGGGDTTTFLKTNGFADKFNYLSIAGGATLEYLAGKTLPGLEVLE
ncbi:MAG: Phosphoglycerate kinase [Candidatus Berkelbacteria bacterium]|nr:Phosphoglycerate kinase [Candidatus Berkelbacteria bacterium]